MPKYNIASAHACAHLPIGFYRPPNRHETLNYNARPNGTVISAIVLHYTVSDYARSYYLLGHADGGRPAVSVHYMIAETGRIDSLVDDDDRAWHAGVSAWDERNGVNDFSIGIELVNSGSGDAACFPITDEIPLPSEQCVRHQFSGSQMDALISLLTCLHQEYPSIPKNGLVAHGDIATDRKIDPGVAFSWLSLHQAGLGIFSTAVAGDTILCKPGDTGETVRVLKVNLHTFGYKIEFCANPPCVEIFDKPLSYVVRAFHLHFHNDQTHARWDLWDATDEARLVDMLGVLERNVEFAGSIEL